MAESDDILSFLDDDEIALPSSATIPAPKHVWRILVVDDDPDVHEATKFALNGEVIQNRNLEFLHAYSGQQALALLRHELDIAVILLDVVMETEDAGLRIIETIRTELNMHNTRIVLRTGQPGYAPEITTIYRYDINDYKTKNELVRSKLYITLTTAIRCYEQLCRMEANRIGLEHIVSASQALILEDNIQTFAEEVIQQLCGFSGIEIKGALCVFNHTGSEHRQRNIQQPTVIAASGLYTRWVQCHLKDIAESDIIERISACLSERDHQISDTGLVLFMPSREGCEFAILIDAQEFVPHMDRGLLEVFCLNISLCVDNLALVTRLRDYAFIDQQLRLPNRMAFISLIDQYLIEKGVRNHWTVALLDVDQFAEVNDMLGHAYGDQLLNAIAQRLLQAPLDTCHIARVAGDKFGIFGEEYLVQPDILQPVLAAPFKIDDGEHIITISIGLVRLSEHFGHGAELIQDASIALKHAKANGFGQCTYYSDQISVETRERTRLLHDLRHAFDKQHLFLVYQPQISLDDHSVIGFEALLRWKNEDGAFVPPDRFIPVAEYSGMIISLGRWVLYAALITLKELQAYGYQGMRMAVNVSAVQFRQSHFPQMIREVLTDTGIHPYDLELEITESVAALSFDYVESLLSELKKLGVYIAIDDFGTGFSSLSYLGRLPADRLKIDKSFVWALDSEQPSARIAEIVIELGRKLNMNILAEGVETAAQADSLRALGCNDAQGYYYAKPMPQQELLDWLAKWENGKDGIVVQ